MTNHYGFGRRTFLKQVATMAGTAPLGATLIHTTGSAQTSPHKEETAHQTEQLAAYAATLRYEDLPTTVVQRAKDCIIDAVATISYGAELPWSQMIIAYAKRYGAGGKSAILGTGGLNVHAPAAALANGALAHAFELDSTTMPNSGSHPSATLFTPALAVAQERGLGGRDLITAFGFHAPGTTGPFGAAVAVSRIRQFDTATMTNALGVAGSLACGLLEFVNAG